MAGKTRSELDKVRDAIGVYRSCTEANDDYYAAIELIVNYAETWMFPPTPAMGDGPGWFGGVMVTSDENRACGECGTAHAPQPPDKCDHI